MKYNIKLSIIILLFTSFVSCIKDKGNYTTNSINKLEIETIENMAVQTGGNLRVSPNITFSLGEDDDLFSYEWYVVDGAWPYNAQGEALATTRNLDIKVDGQISLEGEYTIMLRVVNKKTEVAYVTTFKIMVQNKVGVGYLALCEKPDNKFDLDMIALFMDTMTFYPNVLDLFNSELPREGKPIKILCYPDRSAPTPSESKSKRYSVWVLTDKYTNRLNAQDFSFKETYNISKICAIPNSIISKGTDIIANTMFSSSLAATSARAYMHFNGYWFFYNLEALAYFYASPLNIVQGDVAGNYFESPPYIAIGKNYGGLIYDNTNKKFRMHRATNTDLSSSKNIYCVRPIIDDVGDLYMFNNPNYDLLYMNNKDIETGYAIVKNNATNKYELLQFSMPGTYNTFNIVKTAHGIFPEGIEQAKFFAMNPSAGLPYLYYATEDRVYRVHTSTMTVTDITSQILPSGHKISLMTYQFVRNPRSGLLILGTYNPGETEGKNGKLAFYQTEDGTGNLKLAKHPSEPTASGYQIDMAWEGFGKILSVEYKQQ